MNDVVNLRGVTKLYDGKPVVGPLDLDIQGPGIIGLLGPNGAGKTTTLAMLLGLVTPDQGSVEIFGHDLAASRSAAAMRMNFASPYMDLPLRLSVRENLIVYARLYGVRQPVRRVAALGERFQLGEFLDRPYGRLSAGQKTRVTLAKALVNEPELLLLDEPTASLDPDTADRLRGWVVDYQQARGATVLLASHNMREVEQLCQEVILMRAGHIIEQDCPAALVERYGHGDLEEVFLQVARHESGGTPGQVVNGN